MFLCSLSACSCMIFAKHVTNKRREASQIWDRLQVTHWLQSHFVLRSTESDWCNICNCWSHWAAWGRKCLLTGFVMLMSVAVSQEQEQQLTESPAAGTTITCVSWRPNQSEPKTSLCVTAMQPISTPVCHIFGIFDRHKDVLNLWGLVWRTSLLAPVVCVKKKVCVTKLPPDSESKSPHTLNSRGHEDEKSNILSDTLVSFLMMGRREDQ